MPLQEVTRYRSQMVGTVIGSLYIVKDKSVLTDCLWGNGFGGYSGNGRWDHSMYEWKNSISEQVIKVHRNHGWQKNSEVIKSLVSID